MKKIWIAVILGLAVPIGVLGSTFGYKVTYDGGSAGNVNAGTEVKIYISGDQIRFAKNGRDVLGIPVSSVTEVSYGQSVHRKFGAAAQPNLVSVVSNVVMAINRSKKEYVGLSWVDGDKKFGLSMQCDKNNYGDVLAFLEEITGKRAVDSDAVLIAGRS